MDKIRYAVIGSGWRAMFYIRIAKLIPESFELTAVLIKDREKGMRFAIEHAVKVVQSLEQIEKEQPDFVVLAIKRGAISGYLTTLFKRKIPVLCETPPGEDLETLRSLWRDYQKYDGKVQIAEQYFLQPLYAAWENVIYNERIGEVQNINISSLHGYHGASIIRRYLKEGFHNARIYGKRFWFDVTDTYGRDGMIFNGEIFKCSRDRLTMEFDDGKVAYFDFADPAQYHSFIRTRQINVQGTRGEIDDLEVRYLTDKNLPVMQKLHRIDLGTYNNQEWTHYGIMLGEEFLYRNPFVNARVNDDEIAVASCLQKMKGYLENEEEFYSLREALQDMYICLMMEEAVRHPNEIQQMQMQEWV